MTEEIIDLKGINFKLLEIISKENIVQNTMDIEVENVGYYLLDNGIVSHNTSSILTQTTSGIEPVFLPVYKRRRKVNPQEKNTKVDFVDKQGDSWQEYTVFHHKFETFLQVNGYNIDEVKNMSEEELQKVVEKSPYHKATSNDVDWVEKVEMQGQIQKHIDHSISSTINLPNEATEELVAKVYETGWKSGCKGLTVYREGSRDGVLISQKKQEKEIKDMLGDSQAVRRPKNLNADVISFQNNFEKWIAVIGKMEYDDGKERPYELFTGKHEAFYIPPYVDHGRVVKRKTDTGSVYDFIYKDKDGEDVVMPKLSRSFSPEFWNYAKLISGLMRHRMPMPYVVNLIEGLNLDDTYLNTWKKGVVRILKRYVANGTKSKNKCPNCGAVLVVIEGCEKCLSCGEYSKCG